MLISSRGAAARPAIAVLLSLWLGSTAAFSVAPRPAVLMPQLPRAHIQPRGHSASPLMRIAPAQPGGPASFARAVAPRVASAALAAITFILGRSTRAIAASSGVAVKADPNMVKLGVGVSGAVIACAAYILSSRQAPAKSVQLAKGDEPPAQLDEDATLLMDLTSRMQSLSSGAGSALEAGPAQPSAGGVGKGSGVKPSRGLGEDAAPAASDIPLVDQAFLDDDALVLGDLAARMRQLAEKAPPPPPEPPAVDDSTDEWSKGSTAVLEPPKPKAEPPVFPDGFPLRDLADEPIDDKPPAPSAEEIAMLKRMFGAAE